MDYFGRWKALHTWPSDSTRRARLRRRGREGRHSGHLRHQATAWEDCQGKVTWTVTDVAGQQLKDRHAGRQHSGAQEPEGPRRLNSPRIQNHSTSNLLVWLKLELVAQTFPTTSLPSPIAARSISWIRSSWRSLAGRWGVHSPYTAERRAVVWLERRRRGRALLLLNRPRHKDSSTSHQSSCGGQRMDERVHTGAAVRSPPSTPIAPEQVARLLKTTAFSSVMP